jgi:hypothetical protein
MHNEKVNKRSLAIAAVAVMLLSTTLISISATSDTAFARNERYVKDINQAASVCNSCLNPVSNSNTNDKMISNGSKALSNGVLKVSATIISTRGVNSISMNWFPYSNSWYSCKVLF